MTINLQFANLEPDVQRKFIDIASKDPEGHSPAEWFEHLVPEQLQDSSYETKVFMDGGEIAKEVWVELPGAAGGRWEVITYEIPDRDVSRFVSGHDGGEYTMNNTIMENSSVNRSRQEAEITSDELEAAQDANAVDAELINNSTKPSVFKSDFDSEEGLISEWVETPYENSLPDATDVINVLLPTAAAAKAAQCVWNRTEGCTPKKRALLSGAFGAGAGAAALAACAWIPGVNIVLGTAVVAKVGYDAYQACKKQGVFS